MQPLIKAVSSRLKRFVVALITVLLIVACQGDAARQAPNSPNLTNCRVIQHALGQTCIPSSPLRLVSLDDITLADALALGVSSVGASLLDGQLPDYLANDSNPIARLGKSEQPNLEKMLQLSPDLIIGNKPFGEPIFEQLSQIAPTALGYWDGFPSWREHFDFVANVLDKTAEAKQVWDRYERRVAEIKAALGNRLQDLEVSVAYACCGTMTIDAENSFPGSILADIGIHRPEGHAAVDRGIIILSEERIPDLDADVLFVSADDEDSEQLLANWRQKPLWEKLKAAQKEQVYVVRNNIWRGGNPIAANLVIDDLFKYLVEEKVNFSGER